MSNQQFTKSAWSMAMLPKHYRSMMLKRLAAEDESAKSPGAESNPTDLVGKGQLKPETKLATLKQKDYDSLEQAIEPIQRDNSETPQASLKYQEKIDIEVQPIKKMSGSNSCAGSFEVKPEKKKEDSPPSFPLVGDQLECYFMSGDDKKDPVACKLLVTAIMDPNNASFPNIQNSFVVISLKSMESVRADVNKSFNFMTALKDKLKDLSKASHETIFSSEQNITMTKQKMSREFLLDARFLPVSMERPENLPQLEVVNNKCCTAPDPGSSDPYFMAMPQYKTTVNRQKQQSLWNNNGSYLLM